MLVTGTPQIFYILANNDGNLQPVQHNTRILAGWWVIERRWKSIHNLPKTRVIHSHGNAGKNGKTLNHVSVCVCAILITWCGCKKVREW